MKNEKPFFLKGFFMYETGITIYKKTMSAPLNYYVILTLLFQCRRL